ncbi:MAG: hypothetical protein BWY71_02186 [Planctomycetes bacterium ADurb.Bin412]|nr:MAG: hypothetical protein BWY71_02186 [Planctomycetes bacterium ADurb.Bin412]
MNGIDPFFQGVGGGEGIAPGAVGRGGGGSHQGIGRTGGIEPDLDGTAAFHGTGGTLNGGPDFRGDVVRIIGAGVGGSGQVGRSRIGNGGIQGYGQIGGITQGIARPVNKAEIHRVCPYC